MFALLQSVMQGLRNKPWSALSQPIGSAPDGIQDLPGSYPQARIVENKNDFGRKKYGFGLVLPTE
jgi:hypothetical protein